MNVIVFASRKGGSGKSTLAAHLAAHVHKATKPCLLIAADPQGSLTLWHKLRGTNEPPIKTAVTSVSAIIAAAKREGFEWVFIDTPPNTSAVVEDSIKSATMVIVPARPGVFDVNAVQDTIQSCRAARKPYAVVINGAPARRDDALQAVEDEDRAGSAGQVSRTCMGRTDHQPCRSLDGAQSRRRRPRILCRGPRGGRNRPAMDRERALGEGDPWIGVRGRHDAQAGGVASPTQPAKKARGSRVFCCRPRSIPPVITSAVSRNDGIRCFMLRSMAARSCPELGKWLSRTRSARAPRAGDVPSLQRRLDCC